jgi:dienelactone hydrolase
VTPKPLSRRTALAATSVLAAIAVFTVAVPVATGGFPRFGSGCARDDISVAGSRVKAELCRALRGGGRAVVVLHGCGGFSTFDHRLAVTLPRYGIATLDVDYFGLTAPPGHKGFCDAHGAASVFSTWVDVASAAAAKLRATTGIERRRVGVVGWSLGGAVALAAAAGPPDARPFDAIAGFSTGSFRAAAIASQLPPTILLSGGRTDAIPLSETLPLFHALEHAGVPAALYVYPGGSHNWPGRQGALGIARAAAFLLRYLR